MTHSETAPPQARRRPEAAHWRELMQSGADGAGIEAFALEHLIDLQRAHASGAGEIR